MVQSIQVGSGLFLCQLKWISDYEVVRLQRSCFTHWFSYKWVWHYWEAQFAYKHMVFHWNGFLSFRKIYLVKRFIDKLYQVWDIAHMQHHPMIEITQNHKGYDVPYQCTSSLGNCKCAFWYIWLSSANYRFS